MPELHQILRALRPAAVAIAASAFIASCAGSSGTSAAPPLPPQAQNGQAVAQRYGCGACHSVDGKPGTGPTWKGIWGKPVQLRDGRTVTVDEAYVRRSILEPKADEVDRFASPMPSLPLTDDEIRAVTAYIEWLGDQPSTTSKGK